MTTAPKLTHTIILLVCLKLSSANQNCSNNTCGPMEDINIFEMELELDGNEIQISWDFNSSEPIYGFYGMILGSDKSTLYQTPLLHSNERKMMINYELKESENLICLRALANQTEILAEKCEQVEVNDLKIIIGILAGTIFLIPCILAIIFIICKDYHVSKLEKYSLNLEDEQNESLLEKSAIEVSNDDKIKYEHEKSHDKIQTSSADKIIEGTEREIKTKQERAGKDNPGFVSEMEVRKGNISPSTRGQENPNITDNSHTAIDIEKGTRDGRPKEINGKAPVTLKVDLTLAKQMAEADNEITEYDIKL